ncbi:MAG: hypothetical protein AB1896_13035, partial [Thermodesulfobacteriota bacterium]
MTEVKINEWLSEGFTLYKNNFGVLVVASILTVVLSGLTLGVLAGPLAAGLTLMCLRLYDKSGGPVQPGDVFKGFQFFLNAFLFMLVWFLGLLIVGVILSLIPLLGTLAAPVVN